MMAKIAGTAELSSISLDNISISTASDDVSNDSGSEEETFHEALVAIDDIDAPSAFPSLNSAQRQNSASSSTTNTAEKAPSKAAAFLQSVAPRPSASNSLMPPPSGLAPPRTGGLAAPPSTSALTAPLGVGGASGMKGAEKKRKKVALAPGCSPLDWARLKSTTDLRGGVTTLLRVTPSELKKHNTRDDAWSAFYGKVYNITPYLPFHPGGEDELMRVAGRDGTRLFALTHSWVNIDPMLDTSMVGILTSEH